MSSTESTQPHDPTVPNLVVGLGASAGGIAALKRFFSKARVDSGAAFVVILHLSPEHESRLSEVLQAQTSMHVTKVRDRERLRANHVYVIPPNSSLVMKDGEVIATPIAGASERRSPIDIFFRTLADSHGAESAAVVLSGSGSDGSSGIKRVKEQGGLAIVQDPAEAEHGDMPRHAIAGGMIDLVLPAAEIPDAIAEYQHRRAKGGPASVPSDELPGFAEILALVRQRTGHDFSSYKTATVRRRIERRMALHQQESMERYAELIRGSADEAAALMKELLISVTNFFRDPTAFAALEATVIPRLFLNKGPDDHVRVWVAGCATGEEVYSVAMLLAEAAGQTANPPRIQIFATDLDVQALATARAGHYADADVADLSEVRLRRFFTPTARGGYRVGRELRELILFAHHNLIKDPPFSHLDLVACRNVLIYLNRAMQERVLEAFHFALRRASFLFLGTSESVDAVPELFAVVDKDAHLFEARPVQTRSSFFHAEAPRYGPEIAREAALLPADRIPADLHQRLLDAYGAPSLVVGHEDVIVHVSAAAARFLEMPAGEPSRDLRRLIIPELRASLLAALRQAGRERSVVEVSAIRLTEAHGGGAVRLVVRPVFREGDPLRGYSLILFEPVGNAEETSPAVALPAGTGTPIAELEDELARLRDELRATVEQYESQDEEARASNEELQATNEELRSAAEELETSKEELQSVNEELSTVNQELKINIDELGSTNSDFQNYINAAGIATVFLDRNLRIKLTTSRTTDVFNVLPTDIGRPLSDITHALEYDRLHDDISRVLDTLQTFETEVSTRTGGAYLMRILPYRTLDDRIDGVVLSFFDVSQRRAAEQLRRAAEERLRTIIDTAVDYAIFTMTPAGVIDTWNVGAERMFGYAAANIIGRRGDVLFTSADRAAGVFEEELRRARETGRASDERYQQRLDGRLVYCSGVTIGLNDANGGYARIARDLTTSREAEIELQRAHDSLELRIAERTQQLRDEVTRRTSAQQNVEALLSRLVSAQEAQRARIARDLHDQLGQQLTALRLTLDRLRDRVQSDDGVAEDLARASELARSIDREVDFLAWELRPAVLDDLGLLAALPRFIEEWSQHHQLKAEFQASGVDEVDLSPEAKLTFYRVGQEALNNVVKHAHASRVDVILERHDTTVTLLIEDDGIGFEPGEPAVILRGMGISGMRERAALIGGTIEIESAPGDGTTVYLRAPIAEGGAA